MPYVLLFLTEMDKILKEGFAVSAHNFPDGGHTGIRRSRHFLYYGGEMAVLCFPPGFVLQTLQKTQKTWKNGISASSCLYPP